MSRPHFFQMLCLTLGLSLYVGPAGANGPRGGAGASHGTDMCPEEQVFFDSGCRNTDWITQNLGMMEVAIVGDRKKVGKGKLSQIVPGGINVMSSKRTPKSRNGGGAYLVTKRIRFKENKKGQLREIVSKRVTDDNGRVSWQVVSNKPAFVPSSSVENGCKEESLAVLGHGSLAAGLAIGAFIQGLSTGSTVMVSAAKQSASNAIASHDDLVDCLGVGKKD